jgi:hypothetical protein
MKRYLIFIFDNYDAEGGMNDFKGDFDYFEPACVELRRETSNGCSGHVWDSEERKIVFEYSHPHIPLSFSEADCSLSASAFSPKFSAEIEEALTDYLKGNDNYATAE